MSPFPEFGHEQLEVVEALIADVNARTPAGKTALAVAGGPQKAAVVAALIKGGAQP